MPRSSRLAAPVPPPALLPPLLLLACAALVAGQARDGNMGAAWSHDEERETNGWEHRTGSRLPARRRLLSARPDCPFTAATTLSE